MVAEGQISRFNLYDIFSTFLPGAILITGIFLPLVGPKAIFLDLRLGSLLILTVISFAGGLAVQVLGSSVSSASSAFGAHLDAVVAFEDDDDESENYESPVEVSSIDVDFIEKCRQEHVLSANFDNWDRLFKLVLSELEGLPQSRALRLQALYLGARGMMVTSFLLFIYFGFLAIAGYCYEIEIQMGNIYFLILSFAFLSLAGIFFLRQNEFRDDVVQYMISEYCIMKELKEE